MSYQPISTVETVEEATARTGTFLGTVARQVFVFGRRSLGWLNTTSLQDLTQYLDGTQALLNPVTLGVQYYLRSSSALDTAAGTGAQTVRTVYLDATGAQQVRTDALNGLTGVSLGTGISYIQWCEVATAGSGGAAAGDITISTVRGV